jgi:hypothetical protein
LHRLADLPDRFTYLYDVGDNWTHAIESIGTGRAA